MAIDRANAIVFYVSDMDVTTEFYKSLTLPVTEISIDHIRIRLGAVEVEFHDQRFETTQPAR